MVYVPSYSTLIHLAGRWRELPILPQMSGRLTKAEVLRRLAPSPDDDCGACGHDRHTYHTDGSCRMPIAPKRRCGCPAYIPALDLSDPF